MSALRRRRFRGFVLVLAAALATASLASAAFAAPPPKPSPADRTAERAAQAEDEHEEGAPKPINWADFSNKVQPPYLATVINFALLVGLYVYFGRKPIGAALQARREDVSKQIEEAQNIKREAEARSKQYEAKLGALTDELTTTRAILLEAGVSEKARIVREAEEKAVRMQKDAIQQLEQERRQLQADLQRETVAAALVAAEQLLRTGLTQADQERVAEEFLATLVPEKDAARSGTSRAPGPVAGGAS